MRPSSLSFVYDAGLRVKPLPKVFVVDDDPAVLSSIESVLTAQSYEVICFGSTDDFIAQHQPTHVGCIVIDLSLSGTNGSELLRHLHESRSLLSIVIVSGLIDSAVRFSREKVALPILAKAYEAWTFLTMIEDAIDGSLKRDLISVKIETSQVDWLRHFGPNVPIQEKILKLTPRRSRSTVIIVGGRHTQGSSREIKDQRTHGGRPREGNLQELCGIKSSRANGTIHYGRWNIVVRRSLGLSTASKYWLGEIDSIPGSARFAIIGDGNHVA